MNFQPMPQRGEQLVLASHNQGKLLELQLLVRQHLSEMELKVTSAVAIGLEEPAETATTFEGNARIKALASMAKTNRWVISDDSGLVVDGLDGKPGVKSARWAHQMGGWQKAMERIIKELNNKPSLTRVARFVCVMCLGRLKGGVEILQSFEGKCEGIIAPNIRGKEGFGYDAIFVPNGQSLTFGEMKPAQKQNLSHRFDAFSKMAKYIKECQ